MTRWSLFGFLEPSQPITTRRGIIVIRNLIKWPYNSPLRGEGLGGGKRTVLSTRKTGALFMFINSPVAQAFQPVLT